MKGNRTACKDGRELDAAVLKLLKLVIWKMHIFHSLFEGIQNGIFTISCSLAYKAENNIKLQKVKGSIKETTTFLSKPSQPSKFRNLKTQFCSLRQREVIKNNFKKVYKRHFTSHMHSFSTTKPLIRDKKILYEKFCPDNSVQKIISRKILSKKALNRENSVQEIYVQDNSVLKIWCPAIVPSKKFVSKNIKYKNNSV